MRDSNITSKERLHHIEQAISEIDFFLKGISREMFLNDRVLINAALFQFAIIGEAIVQVDSDVLAKYEYPWHKVRGFRNFILHEYHAIEFRIVWEAIQKDLPELKKVIHAILTNEF
ncbi:MAG TPA: HepT-like ribonuclease domain-containing protein [Flavobacteriaceae bacterium]|jgi:uncharacterized protein with HEPN domain